MPMIEMDEAEVAEMKRLANFTRAALGNPKTRETVLRVQKELDPNAVIPELDAREGVMKVVGEVAESVKALQKTIADERAERAEEKRNSQLQDRVSKGQDFLRGHGYSAEGIAQVEKLMLDENIASYAAGQALFEKRNPPSKPADASTQRWVPPQPALQTEDNKRLWESQGDDEGWLRDAIAGARQDFRQ